MKMHHRVGMLGDLQASRETNAVGAGYPRPMFPRARVLLSLVLVACKPDASDETTTQATSTGDGTPGAGTTSDGAIDL